MASYDGNHEIKWAMCFVVEKIFVFHLVVRILMLIHVQNKRSVYVYVYQMVAKISSNNIFRKSYSYRPILLRTFFIRTNVPTVLQ